MHQPVPKGTHVECVNVRCTCRVHHHQHAMASGAGRRRAQGGSEKGRAFSEGSEVPRPSPTALKTSSEGWKGF
eukprot:1023901-Pyramimonas_sp.AAC.1